MKDEPKCDEPKCNITVFRKGQKYSLKKWIEQRKAEGKELLFAYDRNKNGKDDNE